MNPRTQGEDGGMGALHGVAVVTGGGSGIGAACAEVLAQRGAQVVVLDCEPPGASQGVAHTGGAWHKCDVSDEAAVLAAATEIEARFGPVSILVNNAGVIQQPVSPQAMSMSVWDRIVAVDQRGAYMAAVAFGSRMVERGTGSIVNIASIVGMRSAPLHAYAPAKAALISITQCLAAEWGPSGVRVNAVSPGYTLTRALQDAIDKGERDAGLLARHSALGRLVAPQEIAGAVAFLVSDDARAITGVNLPVDCGWLVASSWHTYGGVRQAEGNPHVSA